MQEFSSCMRLSLLLFFWLALRLSYVLKRWTSLLFLLRGLNASYFIWFSSSLGSCWSFSSKICCSFSYKYNYSEAGLHISFINEKAMSLHFLWHFPLNIVVMGNILVVFGVDGKHSFFLFSWWTDICLDCTLEPLVDFNIGTCLSIFVLFLIHGLLFA